MSGTALSRAQEEPYTQWSVRSPDRSRQFLRFFELARVLVRLAIGEDPEKFKAFVNAKESAILGRGELA